MRRVAIIILVALIVFPVGLTTAGGVPDDCAAVAPAGCVALIVPTPPPPATMPSAAPQGFYLYLQSARCAPTLADSCTGRPMPGAPVGIVGILYEETNGHLGLQRQLLFPIAADKALLL